MIKVNAQPPFEEGIFLLLAYLALPDGPWQLCSSEILSRINAHFCLAQAHLAELGGSVHVRLGRWNYGKRPGGPRSASKEVLQVWFRGLHELAYLTNWHGKSIWMNSLSLRLIVSSSFLDLAKPAFDKNLRSVFPWAYPLAVNSEMSGSWCTLYHSLPCLPSSLADHLSRCVPGVTWDVAVSQAPSARFRTSWLIWCCNGSKTAQLAVACGANGILRRALGSSTLVGPSASASCPVEARAARWLTRAPSPVAPVISFPASMLQDTDGLIDFAGGLGSRPSLPPCLPPSFTQFSSLLTVF
jgi:hypothetical protein